MASRRQSAEGLNDAFDGSGLNPWLGSTDVSASRNGKVPRPYNGRGTFFTR